MINIESAGLDAMLKTIEAMPEQIATLGTQKMAPELTDWQTQDMRRRFPNTKQEDDKIVSTEIWPRSRLTQKQRPQGQGPRQRRVYAAPRGGAPGRSGRPILRQELFDTLCQRMAALMNQALKWQV